MSKFFLAMAVVPSVVAFVVICTIGGIVSLVKGAVVR